MIIIHSRPANISASIVGTGASLLTSASGLTDGKPQRTTKFQWLSAATPATTDYVEFQLTWPTAKVLRGGCFGGLVGFPAGAKFEVRGKRAADSGFTYALGGNALTQLSIEKSDGEIIVPWLFADGLDALVGASVRVFNDAGGSTFLTSASTPEIGESFLGEGEQWAVGYDVGDTLDDPTLFSESVGGQQFEVPRKRVQVLDLTIVPQDWDAAYGTDASLRLLREKLVQGPDVLVYPQLHEPGSSAIDYGVMGRGAVFGKVRGPMRIQSVQASANWGMALQVRQSPGP